MRALRVLLASALTFSAAAVVAADPAVADPAPPFTAVTGTGDPMLSDGHPFAYADAAVVVPTHTTTSIEFDVTRPAPAAALKVVITAPTGGVLTAGPTKYPTAANPTASAPGFEISEPPSTCWSVGGSLTVDEVTADPDPANSGNLLAFAAHYEYDCDGNADPISGDLRYQSTVPYSAVVPTTPNWDFGTQAVGKDGWAKTFVFTNRGTAARTFSSVTTGSAQFPIKANTCITAPVPAGQTCRVTVAPHPTTTSSTVTAGLRLTTAGQPDLFVPLSVLGSEFYPFYGLAGPERVDLNWSPLPAPADAYRIGAAVYRGSSPSKLTLYRYVSGYRLLDHVAAGRTYYYAVRPRFADHTVGDRSPVIADRAWPKYSAGMYHRLSSPARFVSNHRVSAGHTYSLKVLGLHGVPSARVSAVALNVTATSSSATSAVYVYPYGTHRPAAADIAVRAHGTRSNFVLAKVGRSGRVAISTSHGHVAVTVDVFGFFSGAGLSSRYGMGGAVHEYGTAGTIMDTKAWHIGALPHDYYVNAAVNMNPIDTPHVSSLLVEVTAYGSKGSGTITGFATGGRPGGTSVLSYSPNTATSSAAILHAGRWYASDGTGYPSVSLLNRGPKGVQLVVTVLGFVDDNTFVYGQRYLPTTPVHLLGATMHAHTTRTITPGRHGDVWTSAFNEKLSATRPSTGTTVSLRGVGLGAAPAHGQLHAGAHVSAISSTIGVTGTQNRIAVSNSAGTVRVDVWSFGRFQIYPVPSTHNYASSTAPSYLVRIPAAAPGMRTQARLR